MTNINLGAVNDKEKKDTAIKLAIDILNVKPDTLIGHCAGDVAAENFISFVEKLKTYLFQ